MTWRAACARIAAPSGYASVAAPTSRATAADSAATATRLRDRPSRPRREIRPGSRAGGTATAGPKTAAAAWRRRSAGSIGPTTRAARSSADGRAVEGAAAADQRGPQRLGRGARRDQRHRAGGGLHRRGPGADGGGGRQGREPSGRLHLHLGGEAGGGAHLLHQRRQQGGRQVAGAVRHADPPRAGLGGELGRLRDPPRVARVGRRPHDQRRDELDPGLLAGAGDGGVRLGVVHRVGGADPPHAAVGGAEHEAPHDVGRQRAGRPRGCARPTTTPTGVVAGLAQDRAQAVPGALRARLERRPRAAGVEHLEHLRAHLGERRPRRGRGRRCPPPSPRGTGRGRGGSRPRSRRGRAEASRASLRWSGAGYPARVRRGRRTRGCACRSAAGRPR